MSKATHREFVPKGRELVIGHADGSATVVQATEEHGTWVDVPNDSPTLAREARVYRDANGNLRQCGGAK